MSEDLSREDLLAAADALVMGLLEDAGVAAPPVDAVALVERHLRWPVVRREGPPPRPGRPRREELTLDPRHSPLRHQWAAAQAVADHLKPRLLGATDGPTPRAFGESPVTLLAARILLPTPWFAEDARAAGYDLDELHRRYATAAPETIAFRMLDLAEPCVVTVIDNDRVVKRRSNAYRVRRELAPAERRCQEEVRLLRRPCTVRDGGWTVQGWPLGRHDSRREVLRGVRDEGEAGESF